MKSDCGSFLNFTNNRLESLNGKLKQVIDHHSSLEEFFDKFFVILNSFRRKRDHKVATMFQKIKVSCFKDDSPESHYSKFLSSYAAQFVHKQLHLAHKVSTITANGECYVVDTTEGQTNLTPSTCECIFNKSMLLPCRHIFALRIKLDQPLFDTALCDKRWSVAYYQSTHKLFFEQSAADLSTLTVTSEKHHQALSQHQKFHEASLITTELASLASMVSNIHYKRRIELLKELVEFWKNGQMVGLTEISQSDISDYEMECDVGDSGDDAIRAGSDVVQVGGAVSLPSVSVAQADMQVTKEIASAVTLNQLIDQLFLQIQLFFSHNRITNL
ncbi:zinc finger SWIM domain-containing protein 3-like [Dysidea avara]|uniref:zinc finger SWIM domain-containing protein 3-like n=1 Tax=Dysidea avara TaxID=196820 RepID=UPI003316FA06